MNKILNDIQEIKYFSSRLSGAGDMEEFNAAFRIIEELLNKLEFVVGYADMISDIRNRLLMCAMCVQNDNIGHCGPLEEALAKFDELLEFVEKYYLPEAV